MLESIEKILVNKLIIGLISIRTNKIETESHIL